MTKKRRFRRILKWTLITFASLFIILVCFGIWFISLIPPIDLTLEKTLVKDLPYLSENVVPQRGKILAIVTSTDKMGSSDKSTGYELTELSRAYYVFEANGFEVDIASPLGGKPPVIIDDDDIGAFDYAFLNDSIAQYKANHTIAVQDINPEEYEAVFFAGGKGAMFDFPDNKTIQSIIRSYYQSDKVIGAVCHGPAALVHVTLDNGRPLIENKMVSGFTNDEELLLIPDAKSIFPFLLQDEIVAQGARLNKGGMYLEKISHDKNLITGQNPWSTWILAETMIKQLGYTPKYREITDEENAVHILTVYNTQGSQKAKEVIKKMCLTDKKKINRLVIASHSIIAAMKGNIGQFYDILGLVTYVKKHESTSAKI